MRSWRLSVCAMIATLAASPSITPAQPADVDWEEAVAAYHQLDDTMKDSQRAKLTGARLEQRRRWIVATYAGTDLAARSEAVGVQQVIQTCKLEEIAPVLLAFIDKYPLFTDAHSGPVHHAVRAIGASKESDEDRLAASEAIVPALTDRSILAARLGGQVRKLKLTPLARYEFAKRLTDTAGPYPHMRALRWELLRAASRELGTDRYLAECDALITWAGKDTAAARAARMDVLRLAKDGASAQELAAMTKQDADAASAVAVTFDAAGKLVASGDMSGAAAVLEKGLTDVPAEAAEARWLTLLRSPAMAEASAAPVFEVLAKLAPDGDVIDQAMTFVREQRFDAQCMRVLVKLAARHALDRDRSTDIGQFAIRAVATSEDPALQLEALRAAATTAGRVHADDRRVNFLLNLGKMGWDISPDEARAALQEAAARYPAIPEAAEAGWLLAFLDGKLSVTQSPLARDYSPEQHLPLRPELRLPEPPAPSESVVTSDDGSTTTLVKQDVKLDLLKGQPPAASHSAEAAALAVDGDAETSWAPPKLPASLIIPLAKESTVNAIRVNSDSGLYFTASLLDREGRTLLRVERDWAFWDYYRRTNYWPDAKVSLGTLATPGVCFVRLDVYDAAEGDAIVQSVEAFGTPFVAAGEKLSDAIDLPANANSVTVHWDGTEPTKKVTYTTAGEWMRNYYTFRWARFWTRAGRNLNLTSGHAAFSFYGDNASLNLVKDGAVRWAFDEEKSTYLPHPSDEASDHPLPKLSAGGFHQLRIANDRLEQLNDQNAKSGTRIGKVDVDGLARLRVAVRFGTKTDKWGPWVGAVGESGEAVAVPATIDGEKPTRAQAAAFFDGREVQGLETPVLKSLTLAPATDAATSDVGKLDLATPVPLKEGLDDVAKLLQRRALVVVYPKSGTAAEYEAAKRLADKAQCYLMSDDIALNFFKCRPLAVGTPHRNRIARQLLATHGLWNVPAFFADEDGIVGMDRGEGIQATYVIGDTPETVVRAAERLLAAIEPAVKPATPVRIVASNTLENIYGWNIDSGHPAAAQIPVRMAAGDRRSAQVMVIADKAVDKLTISITDPVGRDGAMLPRPLVRPVGFYEWIPFFGETRIPNALLLDSTVSMPANTSRGIWITTTTPPDATAGEYRAELTVDADGAKTVLPVIVRVEPIRLPVMTKTVTHSFSAVPYWFHEGSPQWEKAMRSLARNEAETGATLVSTRLQFKWTKEPQTSPARTLAATQESSPDHQGEWKPYSGNSKGSPAGQGLNIAFAEPIRPREIVAAIHAPTPTPETQTQTEIRVVLSYWDGGQWVAAGPAVAVKSAKGLPRVANWTMEDRPVQYVRLTTEGGEAFTVDRIGAYTDRSRQHPATLDFSDIERQMKVFEEEYAKLGMTPTFLVQTNDFLSNLGGDLFGVNHSYYSGVARIVGPELNSMLERTGRKGRMIFKVADEPASMAFWIEVAADYHRAGLRTMTCHAILPDMQKAAGVANPWCPYYGHNILDPFFRERQKAGDSFWWYTYGPPNMRLTGQPSENIIFYWLTGKWRIDGAMNYAAMHATDFSMPVPFRYEAGQDHRMLFLIDGTLLDTPRRALEGEGISDLKLIEYVRAGAEQKSQTDPAAGKAIADDLEKLLAETIPYKFGYDTSPEHWLKARDALYDLAVRVQ